MEYAKLAIEDYNRKHADVTFDNAGKKEVVFCKRE
ncbi:hypothetical protein OROMI_018373 [Orobanche minor]